MKRLFFEYGVDGARAIGINRKAGMTVQETFECLPEEVVRTPPDDTPRPGGQIRLNVNPRTKNIYAANTQPVETVNPFRAGRWLNLGRRD